MYLGTKEVTRRDGWAFLEPETQLMAVEKAQGIPPGGRVKKIGPILVASVKMEPSQKMLDNEVYGMQEIRLEGFRGKFRLPIDFVLFLEEELKIPRAKPINRIEFSRLYNIPDFWSCPKCKYRASNYAFVNVLFDMLCPSCMKANYSEFQPGTLEPVDHPEFPFAANKWANRE